MLFVIGLIVAFGVALAARLVPMLRGGGLYALGNYDDGVHFAAAMGVIHDLLPYRDFLFLHPPGVLLALAPFAAVADVLGEPNAMAIARVSWMILGAVNAVLCGIVLRPLGEMAAFISALLYAVFFPAVYVEHTALLEPPLTALMLAALVITRALGDGDGVDSRHYVLAGILLGVAPAVKIWGVVTVLVIAVGLAYQRGIRQGLTVLLSAIASCTVIYLPFFLSAPAAMWQMLVVDQLGRRRVAYDGVRRVDDVLGLMLWTQPPRLHLGTAAAFLLLLAAGLVCLVRPRLRLLAALLTAYGVLLMATPSWLQHYSGFSAAPIVLVLGAGLAIVLQWASTVKRWLPAALAWLAAALVLASAIPLTERRQGRYFPGRSAAEVVANVDGCVVTDMPMTLIQMNVLRRNINRGCRYEVDLGGASYHLPAGAAEDGPRSRNPVWQNYAIEYLRSGTAVVIARFSSGGGGFSPEIFRVIQSWPEIGRADRYVIRRPQP